MENKLSLGKVELVQALKYRKGRKKKKVLLSVIGEGTEFSSLFLIQ